MSTVWGCGTMFLGKSNFNPKDGSYETTEWFTVLYIPILPLITYRVRTLEVDTKYHIFPLGVEQSVRYEKVAVEFNWRQILKTYMWAIPVVALIALIVYLVVRFGSA